MRYSRLSTQKVNKIIRCFCEVINATSAVKIIGINRKAVNLYYGQLHRIVFRLALLEDETGSGDYELDEFYFGARRVRGKWGSTTGIERALIVEIVPETQKASSLGLYSALVGLGLLPASIIAGVLWDLMGQ
ncbi:hypothetical protein FACS1894172_00960 [Spirochaetia bacterium]|nr:hypothetical protein FACS1894164_06640 [Spirochaetia bacterium]GHU29570.1 hypothetical protein FACS1894172_00960 [Spirochaetia bacterium]